MGTCCDAYYFKNKKEFKTFVKNYNLGLKQETKTTGCYGGTLSNVLYNNDYKVEPDLIEIMLTKQEIANLQQKYPKDSYEYMELNRLQDGFKHYPDCEVCYLGFFCE